MSAKIFTAIVHEWQNNGTEPEEMFRRLATYIGQRVGAASGSHDDTEAYNLRRFLDRWEIQDGEPVASLATMGTREEAIRRSAQTAVDSLRWVVRNASGILAGAEMAAIESAVATVVTAVSGQTDTAIR